MAVSHVFYMKLFRFKLEQWCALTGKASLKALYPSLVLPSMARLVGAITPGKLMDSDDEEDKSSKWTWSANMQHHPGGM